MASGKWEQVGQMDLNSLPNAPLDLEEATRTDSQFKVKKELYGGMLIAPGLEPLFMELLSFVLNKEILIHSLSQIMKLHFFLVIKQNSLTN